MKQVLFVSMLLGGALTLGGCLPMLAASAVSTVVRSAQGTPQGNAHLASTAAEQCSARAAQYGVVNVIDVQQATPSKIIVWGTAGAGASRQSFQCDFGTKITGFKLRAIKPI
jgi:hypothetical protein